MTSPLRPPSYGAVISNPPNSLEARSTNEPETRFRPERDTHLRARGIFPVARVRVPVIEAPRASRVGHNDMDDLLPPDYTPHPVAGIDRTLVSMAGGPGRPESVPLAAYNKALAQVTTEMNATMGPLQRRLARTIAITGSLVTAGGAIAAGVLAVTALGSTLSGIGLPLGAVAALAGVAVFIVGVATTLLASVATRALLRAPLLEHPALGLKVDVLRDMRDDLLDIKRRSKAEQDLLRNINRVIGKVDGAGAHFKAQMQVMGKTQAVALGGVFLAGISAIAAASAPHAPFAGGNRSMARWFGSKGKPMRDRTGGQVTLPDAGQRIQLLSRVIAPS